MSVIIADTFRARVAGAALTTTKGLNVGGVCTATSFAGDGSGLTNLVGTGVTNNVNTINLNVISGISTFGAAVTVNDTTDSTSTTTGALIVTGGVGIGLSLTVGGSVSVGGTLSYEDVTNIDSVGLITARNGIQFGVAGVGGTIRANGDTTLVGVVTASSFNGSTFTGSGANLTSLPSAQLSGALPALDGSALTNLPIPAGFNELDAMLFN